MFVLHLSVKLSDCFSSFTLCDLNIILVRCILPLSVYVLYFAGG